MTFRPILAGLALEHPAIRGMVFCDDEGERVDSHIADPGLDAYELDVAGACYATLAPLLARQGARRLRVVHGRGLIWMQMLTPRYYLLVLTRPSATDGLLGPHLDSVAEAIVMQM